MEIRIHPACAKILNEPMLHLFRYKGLLCCIQRVAHTGCLNGYVAIEQNNSLYGKHYSNKIMVNDTSKVTFNNNYIGLFVSDPNEIEVGIMGLDMFINVHCGLTYSEDHCPCIDTSIFRNHWWFGFDTGHSGDLSPWQYNDYVDFSKYGYSYKDYDYTKAQVKSLADQLKSFEKQMTDLEEAAFNYFIRKAGGK